MHDASIDIEVRQSTEEVPAADLPEPVSLIDGTKFRKNIENYGTVPSINGTKSVYERPREHGTSVF
jgi:hypothetical protein